jgi:hypothetical protein
MNTKLEILTAAELLLLHHHFLPSKQYTNAHLVESAHDKNLGYLGCNA